MGKILDTFLDIFSPASSAVTGLFGGIASNRNIDKQIAAQREENEKAFQRSMEMAKYQNEVNRQNLERQNAYNSPTAVIERLKQAGLSPDLYYGGSPVSPSVSPQPAASVNPYQPVDTFNLANKKTIGQMTAEATNNALAQAQIRNLNKKTEVEEEERKKAQTFNEYYDSLLQGEVILNGVNIDLGVANTNVSRQTAKKLQKEFDLLEVKKQELQTQIDIGRQTIKNLEQDEVAKIIDNMYRDKHWEAQIRQLSEIANKTERETYEMVKTFLQRTLYLDAQTKNLNSDTILNGRYFDLSYTEEDVLDVRIDGMQIQNDLDKRFGGWERGVGVAADAVGIVGDLFTTFVKGVKAFVKDEPRNVVRNKVRRNKKGDIIYEETENATNW